MDPDPESIISVYESFDLLGIINAKVISKGRYGRTREIKLAIPQTNIVSLEKELKGLLGYG